MRTLLKFTSDITAGNTAIADGRLPAVIKDTMDRLKPEAAYFFAENGNRTGLLVFDLKMFQTFHLLQSPSSSP